MEKAVVLEVYLYIGITSLYLYDTTKVMILQDGMFHKNVPFQSCKWEKSALSCKKQLTENGRL